MAANITQTILSTLSRTFLTAGALVLGSLATPRPSAAQVVAQPPYKITVFATAANGISAPDSIVRWKDSVLVGFAGGVAKDGTDGKSSTIVQFSLGGKLQRTFSVKGHNDGLRIRPETDDLWALQNEDGNPNLVIIELNSGKQKSYTFAPTVHGGGYDDVVFKGDDVFVTASNPNLNGAGVNTFPVLVRATLSGNTVNVEPVLSGDASATDISTGAPVSLNLTDPDSLTSDPRGNIVLDSQADGELVFIKQPFTNEQQVGRILITIPSGPTTVDDTAFAPDSRACLLVTDLAGNTIYRIDSVPFGFEPGAAYSASDTSGLIGVLNLDNGALTPIVTGLGSPRGLLFIRTGDDHREDRDEGR
jgi:hypothetical protein